MKKIINIVLTISVLTIPAISIAAWSPYHNITNHAFIKDQTTMVLDTDFHTCGNNDGAVLEHTIIGTEFAKTFNAVLIAALASERKVALKFDGCTNSGSGTRANITGIRLGD